MDEVAQRFYDWLIKFTVVAVVLLLGAHVLGRRLQARKKPAAPAPAEEPPGNKK